MPLLKLETTVALTEDKRQALLASLSKIVAETIGKPQQYVMVTASQAAMQMSGSPGDAAFVDVRSIGGLTDEVNRKLSQKVSQLLHDSLGIPPNRIYLNFTDVQARHWAGLDIGEVEVNAIWRDSERIVQQLADLLRELAVHLASQPANAPDIHKSRVTRTAGHLHGGLARGHHDVLLRFANGFGDDFGQGGQQGLPLILSQGNGGFEF